MTAKTGRTSQEELSGTLYRASKRHDELVEEVQALRRAGKIREAKGVEGRAQQVEQLVGALEGPAPPGSRPS